MRGLAAIGTGEGHRQQQALQAGEIIPSQQAQGLGRLGMVQAGVGRPPPHREPALTRLPWGGAHPGQGNQGSVRRSAGQQRLGRRQHLRQAGPQRHGRLQLLLFLAQVVEAAGLPEPGAALEAGPVALGRRGADTPGGHQQRQQNGAEKRQQGPRWGRKMGHGGPACGVHLG